MLDYDIIKIPDWEDMEFYVDYEYWLDDGGPGADEVYFNIIAVFLCDARHKIDISPIALASREIMDFLTEEIMSKKD